MSNIVNSIGLKCNPLRFIRHTIQLMDLRTHSTAGNCLRWQTNESGRLGWSRDPTKKRSRYLSSFRNTVVLFRTYGRGDGRLCSMVRRTRCDAVLRLGRWSVSRRNWGSSIWFLKKGSGISRCIAVLRVSLCFLAFHEVQYYSNQWNRNQYRQIPKRKAAIIRWGPRIGRFSINGDRW